eukprot:11471362-Heterocapsa_arctica.AAC.1
MCVSESEREKWQANRAAFLANSSLPIVIAFSHECRTFEGMFARSATQESCAKREARSTSSA